MTSAQIGSALDVAGRRASPSCRPRLSAPTISPPSRRSTSSPSSSGAISGLSTKALSGLTTAQAEAFTPAQINAMTSAQAPGSDRSRHRLRRHPGQPALGRHHHHRDPRGNHRHSHRFIRRRILAAGHAGLTAGRDFGGEGDAVELCTAGPSGVIGCGVATDGWSAGRARGAAVLVPWILLSTRRGQRQ
jgi:hypothetical protein